MRLYDFLAARAGSLALGPIAEPRGAFESPLEVFQVAHAEEVEISRRIHRLYDLAFSEKAFAVAVELQWFISEQVGEERATRGIVAQLELMGDDRPALLDLDRELGKRGDEL